MVGIPQYPEDWASFRRAIEQRLNALEASAQTRVAFTGGTHSEWLTVQGLLTAASLVLGANAMSAAQLGRLLNPPKAAYTKGGAQAIGTAALTGVTGLVHTAGIDGVYQANGSISWATDANGRREAGLRIQGGAYYLCDSKHSSRNTLLVNPVGGQIPMTAGQSLEIAAYQDTGANLNVTAGWLNVRWVGPL